ncbi:MAG TPA: class I SAM-dependent methyltransferase [Methanobacteriaceae archaeon]|nr:class I SAM-dependent methyltransferase [Methanobacteriaceae archaeon]HNS25215.1 class I SAM-dependent methyltransferase [Methanobacteriaceae archaeon]
MSGKKLHRHGGKSSEAVLNAQRVLRSINLCEGDVFMDAGCGDGFISRAASRMVGAEGEVLAVDQHSPSLDILREKVREEKIKNLKVLEADLTRKLSIPDETVDLCLMANVLHGFFHNEELDQAIPELLRILKPGARLAIVEFKKIEGMPGPPFAHRITAEDVRGILESRGFQFQEEMEVGPYHYAVVLAKK